MFVFQILEMKILVKFGEQNFSFEVTQDTKVSDLKKQISQKTGLLTGDITLQFSTIYLLDDKLLSKYSIEDNATILLISKLQGGKNW